MASMARLVRVGTTVLCTALWGAGEATLAVASPQ
jgi:hypothetical protein